MLQVSGLCKSYKGRPVLSAYSQAFTAPRTCLVGANGSGKSTLLACIAGAIAADAGELSWQQQPLLQPQQWVALASDSLAIPAFLTPRQLFSLNQQLWQLSWPEQYIQRFLLTEYLDFPLDTLSAGNQKKAQLIAALMRNTPLLLLDEPNLALDQRALSALCQAIDGFSGQIIAASNEPALFAKQGFEIVELV